jgi:hypothetical protein
LSVMPTSLAWRNRVGRFDAKLTQGCCNFIARPEQSVSTGRGKPWTTPSLLMPLPLLRRRDGRRCCYSGVYYRQTTDEDDGEGQDLPH